MSDYWEENGIEKPQQIVVCAANKFDDVILCGARHWDKVMCAQANAMGIKGGTEEQGFIDQFGDFLTREEAMEIVKKNGQRFDIESNGCTVELYSEGLY
jgi:hypothetical protein